MNDQVKPVPNMSQCWDAEYFDRMEGNIPGKNEPSLNGNESVSIDPTLGAKSF